MFPLELIVPLEVMSPFEYIPEITWKFGETLSGKPSGSKPPVIATSEVLDVLA